MWTPALSQACAQDRLRAVGHSRHDIRAAYRFFGAGYGSAPGIRVRPPPGQSSVRAPGCGSRRVPGVAGAPLRSPPGESEPGRPHPRMASSAAFGDAPIVSVATPETAAVRIAVIVAPSIRAASRPVSGSNRSTAPWCVSMPRAEFPGKTETAFIPSAAAWPLVPGHVSRHQAEEAACVRHPHHHSQRDQRMATGKRRQRIAHDGDALAHRKQFLARPGVEHQHVHQATASLHLRGHRFSLVGRQVDVDGLQPGPKLPACFAARSRPPLPPGGQHPGQRQRTHRTPRSAAIVPQRLDRLEGIRVHQASYGFGRTPDAGTRRRPFTESILARQQPSRGRAEGVTASSSRSASGRMSASISRSSRL